MFLMIMYSSLILLHIYLFVVCCFSGGFLKDFKEERKVLPVDPPAGEPPSSELV